MPTLTSTAHRAGLGLLALTCCLSGCDDAGSSASPPALMARSQAPVPSRVQLEVIAQLSGQQSTQLVATRHSVFSLQGGDRSGVMLIQDGKVIPTQLNSEAVAKSMSLPKARGQITSIAADGDRLAFCYIGVHGPKPVAAVGVFDPSTGEIFTTVDTFSLERADAELISTSERPYLSVQGSNAWLIRVENASLRVIRIKNLRSLQPEVSAQRIDLGSIQDAITRSTWDFSDASTPGTFYLTDTASRWIRQFDENGQVRHVARFDPQVSSISPAALDASGRVLVLANSADGINSTLLIENGETFKALPVASFQTSSLDLKQLRIDRLVPIPNHINGYLGYDATTGSVLRMSLK